MKRDIRFKRILVKVGTNVITSANYRLDKRKIRNIVSQISAIKKAGAEVIIVSSGSIGAGMGVLLMRSRPQSLPELQACAAVGQSKLMKAYGEMLKEKGYIAAQVLLTQEDLRDRKRYLNTKNTLLTLLEKGAIPIIIENDTVSTEEIRFGDNDLLSSLVASLVKADIFIILSDVDGLYRYKRREKRQGVCIGLVERITKEIEGLALKQKSRAGTGGMISKLQAAKIAVSSGMPCVIANGKKRGVLLKIASGGSAGTLFLASRDAINAKKHWIAYTSKPKGNIRVDKGARDALVNKQKSLLASGITDASGIFEAGDVVSIADTDNDEFARGQTSYSSLELKKIRGLKTSQIKDALGYKHYDEVVHRDNLVIL